MRQRIRARRVRPLTPALAAALAGAAIACLAFAPAGAEAATYNVAACNDAGGQNHSWTPWSNSGNSTIVVAAACTGGEYDGNTNKGIFSRYVANSTDPGGAAAGWRFDAPAGNNVASVSLSDWYGRANTNGPYAILASDWHLLEGCFNGNTICGGVYGRHTLDAAGSSEVHTELGCASVSCPDTTGIGTAAIYQIYGATVTVNDLTAPTTAASGTLWTGQWQRGTNTVTIAGADAGDGIQENDLKIDGQVVAARPHGCDYTYAHPCSNQTDSIAYNTAQVSDGPHPVQVVSYDGGQITPLSAALDGTLWIDNHAPSKPTAITLQGASGWHGTNGFGVSWTDPAQGSAAPITAVHYSICSATNPANCPVSDQRVAGGAIHSLSNISAPGAGDWVLRTWLGDAAGNADSSATSDPVHLMYDPAAPGLAEPQHNNGWLNKQNVKERPQPIQLASGVQPGPSGVGGYSVTTDGTDPGTDLDIRTVSGTNAVYSITDLPEGRNVIKARAISGAGVPSAQVGSTEIDVDKTPPEVSVAGAPDPSAWQNRPVTLTITGTDQPTLSGMAASPDSTVEDGAYTRYRVDGGAAKPVPGASAQVTLAADGDHTVSYQAVDLAGNPSTEKTTEVKIDTTAPAVTFESPIPGDPRRVIVDATDGGSGDASGVIEIRRQGTTTWQALPTDRLDTSRFTTYVDDTALDPSGHYELRARVRDIAGNEGSGASYADGSPVLLAGGLRTATHVAVAFAATRAKCKKANPKRHKQAHRPTAKKSKPCPAKRHKKPKPHRTAERAWRALEQAVANAKDAARRHKTKRHSKKPKAAPLPGRRVVPFGKSAALSGYLTTVEGAPLASQQLAVYATLRSPGSGARVVGHVQTDAHGAFRYLAPKGASRTLDFRFEGTDTLYPSDQPAKLLVPAATTLRRSKRVVRNGQTVRFSGRLRGLPLPAVGKLVNLQVHYRRRWRTFATPRTDAKGTWRFTYRFQATRGTVRYRFRAAVKREAAYPYELGYSRTIAVTVRG